MFLNVTSLYFNGFPVYVIQTVQNGLHNDKHKKKMLILKIYNHTPLFLGKSH